MLATIPPTTPLPLPTPKTPIAIRPAVQDDIAFMDQLQKLHTKQVGWMPTKQFEGKIAAGHVLIAEANGEPVGYCIGQDQYFKRDDVGIIYQMNVSPGKQRGLIGATLLKAQFDRSAYGCRLYCCWCAQDIAANRFWEAMGFVPLAFRSGSEKKARTHIFWQKRTHQDDVTTPWWFPSKTNAGSIREDRIVLPIPPGTHWSDGMPLLLPAQAPALPAPQEGGESVSGGRKTSPRRLADQPKAPPPRQFGPPPLTIEPVLKAPKPPKPRQPKPKADPKLITAARELRDRWLEQVNADRSPLPVGKYEVSRPTLTAARATAQPLLLADAA